MRIFLILITSLFTLFASCRSSKQVIQSTSSTDSTVIRDLYDSINLYKNTVNFYEQVLQAKSDAEIEFYPDTNRITITDTTHYYILNPTNKLYVRPDGTIEAEGRIKSLNLSKIQQSQTISRQEETIDSFAVEVDKLKAELSKKQEVKEVEKKIKVLPWYVWLIVGVLLFLWLRQLYLTYN